MPDLVDSVDREWPRRSGIGLPLRDRRNGRAEQDNVSESVSL
jgi:hypothetical protein